MVAILNSAILNSTILDSAMSGFPLKHTHTCQDWFPPFAQKTFIHSFWLNLMMVAILNFAILISSILDSASALWNSDTLFSSVRFTETHLPLLWLWLKLIHSDSKSFIPTQLDDGGHLEFCHLGFRHLVIFSQNHSKTRSLHSDSDSN